MRVEVRLLLTFKGNAPNGEHPFTLEFPDGVTVAQVLESLSISSSTAKVVLVNGRFSSGGQQLTDGDQITVFPPLEGG